MVFQKWYPRCACLGQRPEQAPIDQKIKARPWGPEDGFLQRGVYMDLP